jgi:hypothetical protein
MLLSFVVAAFVVIALPSEGEAGAQSHAGCYDCRYSFVWGDPFSADAECVQVANNSFGDGIYCRTYFTGMAKDCEATGGGCYYIEVNGNASTHRAKHRARKPNSVVVQLF